MQTDFDHLESWHQDDVYQAFDGFVRSAKYHLEVKRYKPKIIVPNQPAFDNVCRQACQMSSSVSTSISALDKRNFFEQNFTPFSVVEKQMQAGLITGYYEPYIAASSSKSAHYPYPFYLKPNDLIELNQLEHWPENIPKTYAFAKKVEHDFEIYPDRQRIESGYLHGKNLELAFTKRRDDAYFAHIQGSACLKFDDGRQMRIAYDGKNGHPYNSIGKILVERGEIPADKMSMQALRDWMSAHPKQVDELLWQNKSFIFFKEVNGLNDNLGPIGAAKIQLDAGRSIAIDKTIYPFGLPVFVSAQHNHRHSKFNRLMITHDTGSAITGPNRGDIFIGSGEKAGEIAGQLKQSAAFTLLLPKTH